MSAVATAIVGGAVVGGVMAGNAADTAAGAQMQSTQMGIAQQDKQFQAVQKLLSPYVEAGTGNPGGQFDGDAYLKANPDVAADPYFSTHPEEHYLKWGMAEGRAKPLTVGGGPQGSLQAQQDLLGLNGMQAQQTAINGISSSPLFATMSKQGEDAILANASATGGLRGGNTQGALAQFRPALLSQLIDQQYQRLGGLTTMGQNSAAGVGVAGLQTGNHVTDLLTQQGDAQAGAALANGRAGVQTVNGITSGFGQIVGSGALRGFGQPAYNQWASNNTGVLDSTGMSPAQLNTAF